MQSLRSTYRYAFPDGDGFPVVLYGGGLQPLVGVAVDLSIGGMLVDVEQTVFLPTGFQVTAGFVLPEPDGFTIILAAIAHQRTHEGRLRCGLQFLPVCDPAAQEKREEALWRFLLAEQRREVKRSKLLVEVFGS